MARLIERVIKKPLSELLLFGSLAATAARCAIAVERRRDSDSVHEHEPRQHPPRVPRPAAERNRLRPDPFEQFARWFAQARELEPDATAMTLATATRDGRPSVRIVLLKGVDDRGFVFYTNYDSRKARELAATGRAACCSTGARSSGRCASRAGSRR